MRVAPVPMLITVLRAGLPRGGGVGVHVEVDLYAAPLSTPARMLPLMFRSYRSQYKVCIKCAEVKVVVSATFPLNAKGGMAQHNGRWCHESNRSAR